VAKGLQGRGSGFSLLIEIGPVQWFSEVRIGNIVDTLDTSTKQ